MIILDVNKVSKNFGFGTLFEDVSFSLNEGESISIVGDNGSGKSTLLKIIAGIEKADTGMVSIKKGVSVGYLDQTAPDHFDDRVVKDVLLDAFSDIKQMQARLDRLIEKINNSSDENEVLKLSSTYSDLLEKFIEIGGYDVDVEISTVCTGLKINEEILAQNYNNLSGGEKTLVHLAKALLYKPQLFLLDEPTNHLDIARIEWLESYIKEFKGATVIISHDRYFLDRMSNYILELDSGEVNVFKTNYTEYLNEKQRMIEKQLSEYKDQQIIIKRLEEQIKYFSERGMATNSSTLCNRAKTLQTKLDKIKENLVARPKENKNLNLNFDSIKKSSKVIIESKDLTVKTDTKTILNKVNVKICAGENIAIIGNNGSGKSTFIKSVLGYQTLPIEGEIKIGETVEIGYLPQIIDFKNPESKVYDYFKEETGINEQRTRSILAKFRFYKSDIEKRVKTLSGGERIRLKLAILLQQKINTLIFDEPTNHIDISTKETLEEALENFNGTIIFVSHDRYFINKFAKKVVAFENASATMYLGNYDDYKALMQIKK